MPDEVILPSGLVVALEAPSVRRLLADSTDAGGVLGVLELAGACLDSAGHGAAALDAGDAFYIACWAAEQLSGDEEALDLTWVAETYGQPPCDYIRRHSVTDFELDRALTVALAVARERHEQHPSAESRGFRSSAPSDGSPWFPREESET